MISAPIERSTPEAYQTSTTTAVSVRPTSTARTLVYDVRPEDFHTQLLAATYAALRFGQGYVKNRLPLEAEYIASLNQSYDARRADDEVVYPEDDGRIVECGTARAAANLLYRDGRCPGWIDISVLAVRKERTVMHLVCCGRYVDDDQRLYYYDRGTQPFGIKSPALPLRRAGRFRLPRFVRAKKAL